MTAEIDWKDRAEKAERECLRLQHLILETNVLGGPKSRALLDDEITNILANGKHDGFVSFMGKDSFKRWIRPKKDLPPDDGTDWA